MAPEVRSTHSSSPDIVSAALNLGLLVLLGLGYLGEAECPLALLIDGRANRIQGYLGGKTTH